MACLGQQLTEEFGRGFEVKNLQRMPQFVQAFPEAEIVATVSRRMGFLLVLALIAMSVALVAYFR